MKKTILYSFILVVLMLLSGCTLFYQAAGKESNKNSIEHSEITNNEASLALLSIILPQHWSIDKSEKVVYQILDQDNVNKGTISAINYIENFDLLTQMPNHSSVTNDENVDIPLGKARLVTLDSDNGSAASGKTGTHDKYYAAIPIIGETIYLIDFTNHDKQPETKQQFIDILSRLSLNE